MVICSGCGGISETRLKCPKCVVLKKPDHYFCSQKCFSKYYTSHHRDVHLDKPAETSGQETMAAGFSPDKPESWRTDQRLIVFLEYLKYMQGSLRPWPTTATPQVPVEIERPDYAATGRSLAEERSRIAMPKMYSETELVRMRASCQIAREALDLAHSLCEPGKTPVEIDDAVHEFIVSRGAYPSPLNYYGFPKSCCISVNEIVCHGIPDLRPLEEGDIVNVDVTTYHQGMHADLNETYAVGTVDKASLRLMKCAYTSMMKAIKIVSVLHPILNSTALQCKPGTAFREIGKVIEGHCRSEGFSVVRNYTGHGCGELFHCNPNIPHYEGNKAKGLMKAGHVFTIEPMVNIGTHSNDVWPDGWTVCTADGKRSAQFEHQILITENGAEILTARIEGRSPPLDFPELED